MSSTTARVLLGFLAGALAVLIFHQGMFAALVQTGLITSPPPPRPPSAAWSLAPTPFWPDLLKALSLGPISVPRLVNQMFWGGLWGSLFALIYDYAGGIPGWLKGILFGMVGPMLLGSWLFFAWLRSKNPQADILAGFLKDYDIMRLRTGFLLNGVALGVGLGLLYPLLRTATGARSRA